MYQCRVSGTIAIYCTEIFVSVEKMNRLKFMYAHKEETLHSEEGKGSRQMKFRAWISFTSLHGFRNSKMLLTNIAYYH